MEVVVDANILISALIKDGYTRKLLFDRKFVFYAPSFLLEEATKYMPYICMKTGLSENDLRAMLDLIVSLRINIVDDNEIEDIVPSALSISPDPNDALYFAVAMKLNCCLLSNDKKLKNQNRVKVYSAEEISRL
ncbi:MAG TPA: putative toxin-antitoxin system toxin component, PIN family [Candidatus Nanoarchaeia archaeon]|nr:putative toxin-antitoxin system toxin component, PIN family [Candidatus Nanoarchaeia archaeon]